MKDIFIVGCGGLGRETAWVIQRINEENQMWNLAGFIDDSPELQGKTFNEVPVVGNLNILEEKTEDSFFVVAIANPKIRQKIVNRLKKNSKLKPAVLIDPSVIISDSVEIGKGTIILPGCIITVNVKLSDYSIINYAVTIGHDSQVGSFCTIYPGAHIAGNVSLGTRSQIGTGAIVLQGLTIGPDIFIGGQAAVVHSVNQKGTYAGVPVHKLPEKTKKQS